MRQRRSGENRLRFFIFLAAALLHAALLYFVVFQIEKEPAEEEAPANLIRLVDVQEERPPPPPREMPPEIFTNTVESVAENMVETDEDPGDIVVPDFILSAGVEEERGSGGEEIEYVPMSRISVLPVFPEDQIRKAVVYPPIALRSNIEGIVYLELFVDGTGEIRQIDILRENPEGRGFGQAAVNAFKGIKALKPAEAGGRAVAVRYRYPVRFTIR